MHGMLLYSHQLKNKPKLFGGSLETELHSFIEKLRKTATADGTGVIVVRIR